MSPVDGDIIGAAWWILSTSPRVFYVIGYCISVKKVK